MVALIPFTPLGITQAFPRIPRSAATRERLMQPGTASRLVYRESTGFARGQQGEEDTGQEAGEGSKDECCADKVVPAGQDHHGDQECGSHDQDEGGPVIRVEAGEFHGGAPVHSFLNW